MKTLKEYIAMQSYTDMSDQEVILAYFVDNNMEEEAMELTHKLAKAKIGKMRRRLDVIETWAYIIPSEYLYQTYSIETASMLHRLELDYIVNREVTGRRLEWAKENCPSIVEPEVYFVPCIDWLAKHGVRFKDDKENDNGKTD